MHKRSFDIDDTAVASHLDFLHGLSQHASPRDRASLHQLLVEIIQVHQELPQPIRGLIPIGHCILGDTLWEATAAERDTAWSHIKTDLNEGLDLVVARLSEMDPADLKRYETVGERVLKVCAELRGRGNDLALAHRLVSLGAGSDVASDARQLVTLFGKKHVRNRTAHDQEVSRLLAHIEALAQHLHRRA